MPQSGKTTPKDLDISFMKAALVRQIDNVVGKLAEQPNNLLLRCVQRVTDRDVSFSQSELRFLKQNQIADVSSSYVRDYGGGGDDYLELVDFKQTWKVRFAALAAELGSPIRSRAPAYD